MIFRHILEPALGPSLKYADEVLVVYVLILTTIYSLYKSRISILFFYGITLLLYLVIVSILFGYNKNLLAIILQSIIHLKFFFIIIFLLSFSYYSYLRGLSFIKFALIIIFLGLLLHLLLGESLNTLLNIRYAKRDQSLRFGGILDPNHLSYLSFILCAILINNSKTIWNRIILYSIFGLLIFITGSRTPLLALLILIAIYESQYLLKKPLVVIAIGVISILLFTFLIFKSNIIDKTIQNLQSIQKEDKGYIRGIILTNSILLAQQHFPIGTGAATFGSTMSNDSEIYELLGISDNYYVKNKIGIYDSNFGSILGEFGIVGVFLIYFYLFLIYWQILSKLSYPEDKRLFLGMYIGIIIATFTMPLLMNSAFAIITSVGLLYFNITR